MDVARAGPACRSGKANNRAVYVVHQTALHLLHSDIRPTRCLRRASALSPTRTIQGNA